MQHTADGDTAYALSDAAGRPHWSRSAEGTVTSFIHEPAETAGRLQAVTEESADSGSRVRERLTYGAATDDDLKNRNLAGAVIRHCDNAGFTETFSIALTGHPLKREQQQLPPYSPAPDWSGSNEPETEGPLTLSGTYDATGSPLTQTNAAGVTTISLYDVSGAVRESRLRYAGSTGEPEKERVTLRNILRRANGVVLSQMAGNGILETFIYDDLTQLLSRHTVQRQPGHPLGALVISDLCYTYDPTRNILSLENIGADPSWHNNQQITGRRVYGYDTLYRLTSATGRERVMSTQRRGPLPRERTDPTAGSTGARIQKSISMTTATTCSYRHITERSHGRVIQRCRCKATGVCCGKAGRPRSPTRTRLTCWADGAGLWRTDGLWHCTRTVSSEA